MRFVPCMTLGLLLIMCGGCGSRDEVMRVTSPDGRIDAIVIETNCGAPCDFGYEVRLGPKDVPVGEEVAFLYGATRSEYAAGVNLRWSSANNLAIEYLRAKRVTVKKHTVRVADQNVQVSLQEGLTDAKAPAGGMLHPYPRQ